MKWQDNPKITFIGAGSTVFMKNIVGDVLQRPALAGATIALMDINPQRLEESAIVAGKLIADARRARRRSRPIPTSARRWTAPTSSSSPSRSAATSPAPSPISRCPRNTACARPSPTRSASAASCAASAPCRICGRSARTCSRSAPRRSCCNTSTRWRSTPGRSPRNIRPSSRSASAIRCRARPMELAHDLDIPVRGNPLPRRRHQPHGLLPQIRASPGRTAPTATSIPTCVRGLSRGPGAQARAWNPRCPNKVRYEMLTRLGYFVTESSEHFAEYTPYFIKEGRDGPDREVRHPARRISQALHRADRALEGRGREPTARPTRIEVEQSQGIRLLDHELGVDRRAVGDLRQCPQQWLHHLAARQLRRRSAVPRRCLRHPADLSSATCRRSSRR